MKKSHYHPFIRSILIFYQVFTTSLIKKMKIKNIDLSLTQLQFLKEINLNPKISQKELLAKVPIVSKSDLSLVINKLVKKEFIIKEKAADDRRKTLLQTTSKYQIIIKEWSEMLVTYNNIINESDSYKKNKQIDSVIMELVKLIKDKEE